MSRFHARPISNVGTLEQLAGVEDRFTFWKPLIPTFQQQGTEAGMKLFSKKCRTIIQHRINAGELCLCEGVQL
jgi:hypothetical protein